MPAARIPERAIAVGVPARVIDKRVDDAYVADWTCFKAIYVSLAERYATGLGPDLSTGVTKCVAPPRLLPVDVFTFLDLTGIRDLWPALEPHVGRTRAFWIWILDAWDVVDDGWWTPRTRSA